MPQEHSRATMFGSPFGSPRIQTKALADLCRRLSMSLGAGVDVRRIVAQEAVRASGMWARQRLQAVRDGVQAGNSLYESLQAADDYFPPLFVEMVQLGEQTGRLSETFALLADHYEGRVRLARTFLASLTWPLLELAIALAVVGLLIWIQGVLGAAGGANTDLLGLGLSGTRGLVIYLVYLAAIGFGVYLFIRALRRGALWTRPLQRLALRVPGLGKPLRVVCLARLAWAMHLTFSTGMEVRRALRLSLRSAQNAHFSDQIRPIERALDAGESVADAFRQTEAFPGEFLDTLEVAEHSGRLAEAMAHLSEQYRQQAEVAMRVLATIGGFAVYAVIALFLIALIFTLAFSYFGMIRSLAA
jgi:type II secretory pathway component PulF